jgi:hypothetical protein
MKEHETIPEGEYSATLMDVVEQTTKFGASLRFAFEVNDPGYEGTKVSGMCSKSLSPRTKLFRWLTSLGVQLAVGQQITLEDLIGTQCYVEVALSTSNDGSGTQWLNVVNVKPFNRHRPAYGGQPQTQTVPVQPGAPQPARPQVPPPQQSPQQQTQRPAPIQVGQSQPMKKNPFVKEIPGGQVEY